MAIKKNPLHQFASYNYIFELSCLTFDEIAKPDETYRASSPQNVIFRSGGGAENKVTTIYEDAIGAKLEYYVDDVSVESLVVPNSKTRTTNATHIEFTVYEPYSMGLFLQTLQLAAVNSGHVGNYIKAPFNLSVQFVGYDDDGDPLVVDDGRNLQRHFPLYITNVEFNVTAGGCTYRVEGIPWNEQAVLDTVNEAKTDISIAGSTIVEVLQSGERSLATVINGRFEELRKANLAKEADELVISFPEEIASGYGNPNAEDDDTDQGATTSGGSKKGGGIFGKIVAGAVGGIIGGALSGNRNIGEAALGGAIGGLGLGGGAGGLLGGLAGGSSIGGLLTAFKNGDVNALFQGISGFLGAQAPQNFEAFVSMITGQVFTRSNIGDSLTSRAQDPDSLNPVGRGGFIRGFNDGGTPPFAETGLIYDKNSKTFTRAKNTVSDDTRVWQFPSGSKITRMIEKVILDSNWAQEILDRAPDEDGMLDWFRIECETYLKPGLEVQNSGESAKVYHYKVIKYQVHSSTLQNPKQAPTSYSALFNNAVKEYNYIYTGENKDIIDFDIQLNSSYFVANLADAGQSNIERQYNNADNITAADSDTLTETESDGVISATGSTTTADVTSTSSAGGGGSGLDGNKRRIAQLFHDSIINSSVDLIQLELEILGDPYFIFDSGMGNYTSFATSQNETSEGSIEVQRSQCHIIVNFRTPIDYNEETGGMHYPEDTVPVAAFSGLYMVTTLVNSFSGGRFQQRLTLTRKRNQESDTTEDLSGAGMVKYQDTSGTTLP